MKLLKTILKSLLILQKILFSLLKIISIFLLFTQLNCSHQNKAETQDQIAFEPIHLINGVEWQIFADFDGDGNKEYIYNVVNGGVVLHDFDGPNLQSACQFVGTLKVGKYQALDFTGDPSPEIFLPVKRRNHVWVEVVEVIQSYGEIDCRYILKTDSISGIDIDNDEEWDGKIERLQVLDINEDGQKDILTGISTGFDRNPRGIYSFDGKNGEKLWNFLTAGVPFQILCADINSDGNKEIIFGTSAPDNGNIIGDMDDSHNYLICLTKKGDLLWKHKVGGIFCSPSYNLINLNNDGESKIICTYASGNLQDKSTKYELQLREGKTGKVIRYFRLPAQFSQSFLADLDRDGKDEMIVTNRNGFIYAFNLNLELLKSTRIGSELEYCDIREIVDIFQDGQQEILVANRNKLLVLNQNLEIIGKYQSEMAIHQVHYFKHPYYGELISLTQSSPQNLRNSVLLKIRHKSEFKKLIRSIYRNYSTVFLIGIFLLGCLVTLFSVKIIPSILKRSSPLLFSKLTEQLDLLLNTLAAFGHGQTATTNLDRLCFLFKNPPEDEKSLSEYRDRVEKTIATYHSFTSDQIEEIVKRSKSAKIGMQYINNLQNNFEKLESLLKDYKNKDISQNQSNIYNEEIPGAIESIEQSIEAIKIELTCYYQSDIFTIIKEVLASFSNDLKAEEINSKNLILEGDLATRGDIGKTDLTTIFENIIRNAIESMKQTSIKELLVKIIATEDKIFLEITDTGCGIEQENFDKIFDSEFSTKTEGGFGLLHAKTTLNKYGGKIKVAQSEVGKGTTMRIEIKRV